MNCVIEQKSCTGCMACKNICPKNAIEIKQNDEGFNYPFINQEICINCGLCRKVCPVICKKECKSSKIETYACKNKDDEIRMKSSSGGMFTLIAESILEQNGVVFGVKFNEKFEAVHDYVEKKEELAAFRGSKYVQSNVGDNYLKVKGFLQKGRKVLFTGTPCQIEGLLSFLQEDYDNLYTQDIICHGVPSPKVWKNFLEYKKQEKHEKIQNVNFRKKDILGWNNFQMNYQYCSKEENICHQDDPYMRLFLEDIILRSSCYQCHFKKIKRNADITIADFWGINEIYPEMNDEKGISAVIVHSKKGEKLLEQIKEKMIFSKVSIEDIMKHNKCISQSVSFNKKRENFFKDLDKKNFEELIIQYLS